jgi:hypothetical protein
VCFVHKSTSSDVGCLWQWRLSKTSLLSHALHHFHMYDLFVLKGGRQNKNYHFWSEGTMFGSVQFFQFVPSEKRRCTHMPCIIFICPTFLCQKEVAKTKIIIFGAGEPHQAISEFPSSYPAKIPFCAHCLAQFSCTRSVSRQNKKLSFLEHIRQFPIFYKFCVCSAFLSPPKQKLSFLVSSEFFLRSLTVSGKIRPKNKIEPASWVL